MYEIPSSSRAFTTSRASIRFTGKCLPTSRRKSSTDSSAVQSRLLTSRAAFGPSKSRRPLDLALDAGHPAGHGLLAVQHPLAGCLRIADQPGRSPDQQQRSVTGSLQSPGHHQLDEVAHVDARRGRVEPDVEGDGSRVQMLRQRGLVGGVRHQAPPSQLVEDCAHPVPATLRVVSIRVDPTGRVGVSPLVFGSALRRAGHLAHRFHPRRRARRTRRRSDREPPTAAPSPVRSPSPHGRPGCRSTRRR